MIYGSPNQGFQRTAAEVTRSWDRIASFKHHSDAGSNFKPAAAAEAGRWRGRIAPRHRGGGYHPRAVRRSAPSITRIQPATPPASKLASGFAADPPPR